MIGNDIPIVCEYSSFIIHLKGLNMGNKRKQACRAANQALKSKPCIHYCEIGTIIVNEQQLHEVK